MRPIPVIMYGSRVAGDEMKELKDVLVEDCDEKGLTSLVNDLAAIALKVAGELRSTNSLSGASGEINVHGEQTHNLDQLADTLFIDGLRLGKSCQSVVSEEREEEVICGGSRYLVAIDPLDGSSNLESSVPVGTIFGIYEGQGVNWQSSIGQSLETKCAGFVCYGIRPSLYISLGKLVSHFVLDWPTMRWVLLKEGIRLPAKSSIFSCNEANSVRWSETDKRFLTKARDSIGSSRYSGSLVADCEKILQKGGLFAYPADSKSPQGKLRLLYECLPMGFIFEAAGGGSSDGKEQILNILSRSIHQRVPFYVGSKELLPS